MKVAKRNDIGNPWGLELTGLGFQYGGIKANKYFYNGKELIEDNGLQYYDYGARMYDATIGRWGVVDPLAGNAPGWSPYRAFFDNPIYWTDPTGMFENDYSIDLDGNVKLEEETDDDFDMLYTKSDWEAGKNDNGLKINDRSILPELAQARSDFKGNYAISDNMAELFNVFYFSANNTNVEWGIDGYRTGSKNEYIIRTSHNEASVSQSTSLSQYDEFNMIFNIHSHPGSKTWEGTKGGSGFGERFHTGDMANLIGRYGRFRNAGMTNIDKWFKKDGVSTVFPKHYVYHKQSSTLYHHNPWKNNVFIRRVSNGTSLHRGLGF